MIILLHGQDTYRSGQKLKEIIDQYKKIHKSGLNLRSFDGENLKYQNFIDETNLVSMFDEKKLIILRGIASNKDFQEKFLENKKDFAGSDNIILFYETKDTNYKIEIGKILKYGGIRKKEVREELFTLMKSYMNSDIIEAAHKKLIDMTLAEKHRIELWQRTPQFKNISENYEKLTGNKLI